MKNQLYIPKELVIGQIERTDTYTGRLAYVIYKDQKGVLRKETSFNSWLNASWNKKVGDILECNNVPTSGFVLNRSGGGTGGNSWDSRRAFIRVYDPRDFEFEISIPNLLYILSCTDCSRGKGLEGEFVYAWEGKDLVLLPANSIEYKNSIEFSDLKSCKVSTKQLKLGHTFYTKNQKTVIYLGKYDFVNNNDEYYGIKFSNEHVFQIEGTENYESIKIDKLAKVLNEHPVFDLAERIELLENSGSVLCADKLKITKIDNIRKLIEWDYYYNNNNYNYYYYHTFIAYKYNNNILTAVKLQISHDGKYFYSATEDLRNYYVKYTHLYTLTIVNNKVIKTDFTEQKESKYSIEQLEKENFYTILK